MSLDDGKYTVFSSVSIEASRATLIAQDVTATSVLSGAATTISGAATLVSTLSVGGVTTHTSAARLPAGSAILPGVGFNSEVSLGFFRSAASQVQQSYGTFNATGISATVIASSSTTAQSGATAKLGQGQLYFSVLSLTSNGGEFGFRSGNTVYRFSSDLAG